VKQSRSRATGFYLAAAIDGARPAKKDEKHMAIPLGQRL
jgi:hypothetical protein